jgi:sulfide dehydrogenase cytochrome subunit
MLIKSMSVISLAALVASPMLMADDENMRGRTIGVTCAGCHGTDGAGGTAIPPLKGRDAEYLETAMMEYKADKRPGTIMPRIAKGYSDEDIKAVAAYFANMKD